MSSCLRFVLASFVGTILPLAPAKPAIAESPPAATHAVPPITSPRTSLTPGAPPGDGGFVAPKAHGEIAPAAPLTGPTSERLGELTGFDPARSTELPDLRNATSTTFRNPDGTHTTKVFSSPVYMQDAAGTWVDIDTTLRTHEDGRIRPEHAPADQSYAKVATDPMLARLVVDGSHSVGFGLTGANEQSLAVASRSKVTYPGALGTTSLTLTAKRDGMKEELVLAAPGGPTTFDFVLHLDGMTADVEAATGDVIYRDESGNERARTPHGWMHDATLHPRTGEPTRKSRGVAYSIVSAANGEQLLRVSLDEHWLAETTAWPVTVDPSYWLATDFEDDTYVMDNWTQDHAWENRLKIGTYDGGYHFADSYIQFDVSGLNNRDILTATLALENSYSPSCSARGVGIYRVTQAWGGHSMTGWPGAATAEQVAWKAFARGGGPTCPGGWEGFDVHSAVHYWTHGTWGPFGLMIGVDDVSVTDNNAYKEFKSWDDCGGGGCTPHIDITWNSGPSTPALGSPGNGDTSHNLRPTLTASASDPNGDTIHYQYEVCGLISGVNQCGGSGRLANGTSWQVPEGWLAANQTYTWRAHSDDGLVNGGWSGTRTFTPTNTTPTVPTLRSPVGVDAVVGTSTLSFTADSTDGNGDPIKYRFQVATGSDGQTGRIATSTWQQSATTWTPPPGTFADGGTYYWTAQAQDSWGATTSWRTAQQFRIDFRLGKRDTMPYDALGPATVNLSNGNLLLSVEGPSFPTVGGPVGVSFSYNSQNPVVHGMVGDYYQDVDADGVLDAGEPNLLHRIDPTLDFSFGSGSGPNPGVLRPDRWIGHWSGSIRVPAGGGWGEGDYVFVSDRSDDSVTLRTGGPTGPVVLSAPGCCQYVTGSTVRLSPTSGTNLDLLYTQATGPASLRLRIRKASAPAGSEIAIPSDWLITTQPALPDGWSRSADSPVPDAYTSVRPVTGTTTAVVDDAGTDHLFTWAGTTWSPPAGEKGILTQSADGTWTLAGEDGYLYTFRSDGKLASIVSATDDIRPGAPVYQYQPLANGVVRLRTITDAAGRAITFSYAPSTECPVPPVGFDTAAPADMLCKVSYLDGTETRLYYSGGHLARIVNPGGATVDFGYDAGGLLRSVRDVLTNDLIASGAVTDPDADTHKTLIDYVSGRVTSVKGPVADAATTDAQRPRHTFAWTVNATTKLVTRATVDVAGLSGAAGQPADARVVDLDSGGHATRDVDLAGIAVDTVWDNLNDRPDKVADGHFLTSPAGGLVTTTKYDAAGRVTDTFGPAPVGEFTADNTSATAPRAHTDYDEGMVGLAAAWFATPDLTGAPKGHTTSALNESWGTGSPATGVPADDFSGRLTGEVTVPGTSAATLTLNADGGRVYVDGALAAGDSWGGPYRSAVRADQPGNHWRLGDASSTTAADSAGFSPGTYTGGVTRTADNLAADGDQASRFDGVDDRVTLPAGFENFTSGMTVEAWVRPTAVKSWGRIFDLGNGTASNNIVFARNGTGNTLSFEVYNGGTPGGRVDAPNALVLNEWQHVAATMTSSGAVTIYRNGTVVATGTTTVPLVVKRTSNYIGRSNWATDQHWAGDIDEPAVYPSVLSTARIAAHVQAGAQTSATATATVQPGTHALRVDYQELVGNAGLSLTSSVAGTTFAPRYNLATSHKDADGRWTRTEYATPEVGLPTATVVDPVIAGVNPNGLNLRSTTNFEPASATTFFRRTARTMPKGAATTVSYTHYLIGETADNPCPGGQSAVSQAGALKRETAADPDGGGPQTAIVREYRHDRAGRVVARRIGNEAWACTSFDDRGRVTSRIDSAGKSTLYTYALADRVTETATGSDGVTRTTVSRIDWLGRTVAYTDELGTTTRRTFDQLGRLTGVYRSFQGQAETTVQTFAFDSVGRIASSTEHLSEGPRTTTFGYNAAGQLVTVTRPNGVVTTTGLDATRGWVSSLSNTRSGTELSQWTYQHAPSGDVTSEVADTLGRTRTFGFDGAGRLTGVGGTTTRNWAWDANSNRCAQATSCTTPDTTFDNADRIVSSPEHSSYAHDAHGNVTSATPRTQPGPVPVSDSFSFDGPAAARSYPIVVGQAGTVQADVDWTDTGTAVSTTTTTGSLGLSPASTTAPAMTGPRTVDTQLKGSLSWTKSLHRRTDWTALSVPGSSSSTQQITTDATADIVSTMDWTSTSKPLSDSGTVTNTTTTTVEEGTFTASGNGEVKVRLTWDSQPTRPDLELDLYDDTTGQLLYVSRNTNAIDTWEEIRFTVGDLGTYPSSRRYRWKVHAKIGSSSAFTLSGHYPVTPTMDLKLEDASGNVVASSNTVAGTRRRNLTKTAAPAGTYYLRASSSDHDATPSLSTTYSRNDWANLNLTLKKGTTTVAAVSSSAGQVDLAHIVAPADSTGTFTWAIENTSSDLTVPSLTLARTVTSLGTDTASGSIAASGTATRQAISHAAGFADVRLDWAQSALGGFADLTVRLKRAGGQVVAQTRSSTGSATITTAVPAAETYTVEIVNNSGGADVSSYNLTTRLPRRAPVLFDMALKNSAGSTVASATGTKPRTLSTTVASGAYTLVVTPTSGKASATLSGSHPDHPKRFQIAYDAEDHATRIDDGKIVVAETLAPSGRVLRRVVTEAATGAVTEDTDFGYDGPGDSPAYARPHAGGIVTTYLGDVLYRGTAAAWQLVNLHGDVVGTTDAAGAFTAHPSADEFGVGQVPADRLGWLGGKDRFNVGGRLGLIRMGVRLYDTTTGRFTSVDPVEGGTPNDYVYPADAVNEFDLDGTRCWTGKNRNGSCRSLSRGAGRATRVIGRGVAGLDRALRESSPMYNGAREGGARALKRAHTIGTRCITGAAGGAAFATRFAPASGPYGTRLGAAAGCIGTVAWGEVFEPS